ncbi:MAG: ABC transporter permease subunit [Clostridiales bacterium]|nr:ABC transporter permease subunit [Clostridiales bacterium]
MRNFWIEFKKEIRKNYVLYLMAVPSIVLLIAFNYIPMFGQLLAFKAFDVQKGILRSPWNGIRNFTFLFSTTDAWIITRNTVCYNVVFIALNMFLSVSLAIALNELRSKRAAKVFQTIFIMPHFLSIAIIAIIVFAFLGTSNGFVNVVRRFFGLKNINWYYNVSFWPGFLVFVNAWKGVGYSAVVYLASISGISMEFYEAAMLDGATKMQQVRYITLPHLRAIATILLIMSVGSIFNGDFGLFYTVTQNTGQLYPVTQVIDTYVYNALMTLNDIGRSSAATFYQTIVGFCLVMISNGVVRKIDPDNSLF